ncbi:hypothetical protein LTR62_004272 [Meristemomyces frigidus]|uniref:tripeptidyl-peptidase II n=1 Tax=Meristemomyces frigidus TaxID=1508187 RepID=A0AAN7YK60_9PEZI|nr:hypothetical protein LTR62_004272 [Meristemomyces frigidus]
MGRIAYLLASALPAYAAVHEQLSALPFGWAPSTASVADGQRLDLSVALQYQGIDSLEAKLAYVSTPGSPGYGKYIDLDQQNAMFGAGQECEDSVTSWLSSAGISGAVAKGGVVSFTTTVGQANKLLNTTFGLYTNGAMTKLRTMSYSVPDHLSDVVDLISPTTYFGNTKAQNVIPLSATAMGKKSPTKRQESASCQTSVTIPITANTSRTYSLLSPLCLKQLYNIGDYSVDVAAGSTIAFGSFLNESASYSDLAQFEQIFGIPSQNFSVKALINGGVDNQNATTELDGEANLDVQNIIGLVDGLPVYEYITGGLAPIVPDLLEPNMSVASNEPYLEYYTYLLSQPNSNLPYVITNSYGDHENTVPERYAKRVCNQIGMMGLRGRTVLESSGDEGVGAVCRDNVDNMQPQFTPQFPGTCPYVTAVGGTQFVDPEQAWNASSGGFSFYFPTAWYQKNAVNTYLNKYINPVAKTYYSSNNYTDFAGRGFPDISAHSLYPDYLTVIGGEAQPNGGTSAASPVVAAIMALLNDARFRAGQPALGFVNPLLYSKAAGTSSLNDITLGAALGCQGVDLQNGIVIAGAGIIPYATWNATVGWDPVTGLGTPNFQNLKNLVLSVGAGAGHGGLPWSGPWGGNWGPNGGW